MHKTILVYETVPHVEMGIDDLPDRLIELSGLIEKLPDSITPREGLRICAICRALKESLPYIRRVSASAVRDVVAQPIWTK